MDQNICRRIEQWIDAHFDGLLRDACTLVAVPSVSDEQDRPEAPFGEGCRKALDTALGMARGYGFMTENYGNRCGSVTLRPGREEIAFWGHLDVVPPGTAGF